MKLGLFPLNLVLFPDAQLPLHVFEPRYRTLIGECISSGSEFGINLVDHGHQHPIGCTARVVEVVEKYSDGRMDIIVEGVGRYRLLEVDDSEHPYSIGRVEPIEDEDIPVDPTLLSDCADLYNQILDLVYGGSADHFSPEDLGTRSASFTMAPKSGLSSDQKQSMLELTTENSRLELLRDHLASIVPTIRQAELIQRVVKSDGYLPAIDS